jgi:hypothetical protein
MSFRKTHKATYPAYYVVSHAFNAKHPHITAQNALTDTFSTHLIYVPPLVSTNFSAARPIVNVFHANLHVKHVTIVKNYALVVKKVTV